MMWKHAYVFLFLSFCHALTDEEQKASFTKKVIECMKKYPHMDMAELFHLKQLIVPTNMDTKCLLACAYKLDGVMTPDGKYDLDHAYKRSASMSKDVEDKRVKNGKKLADICVKVNDEAVTDGEAGCDRAALMFKCVIDHAPKLGFKL